MVKIQAQVEINEHCKAVVVSIEGLNAIVECLIMKSENVFCIHHLLSLKSRSFC